MKEKGCDSIKPFLFFLAYFTGYIMRGKIREKGTEMLKVLALVVMFAVMYVAVGKMAKRAIRKEMEL